jgi:cell wall-associated NlpC family hydrolase
MMAAITYNRKRMAMAAFAAVLGTLVWTASSVATPAEEIREKQAEAERVLAQIHELDIELEEAIEAWNGANVRLDELQAEIDQTKRHLQVAKKSHGVAQDRLAARLVALYTGQEQSTIEIVLGASSLDELIDRIDTAQRISDQDVQILDSVAQARAATSERKRQLDQALAEQSKVVQARSERKAYIEGRLDEREALAASIADEIDRLEAEEAARQRRIQEELERRREEAERIAAAANVQLPAVIAAPEGIGTAPPSAHGNAVVAAALTQLGVPYVWGGASPGGGFDCSGLVVWAYAQAGRPGLPHYTGSLWQMGVAVSYSQLQPGDLVWFYSGGHMGIYMGGGQMVHAPHTGDVVKVSDISPGTSYYSAFLGARRI